MAEGDTWVVDVDGRAYIVSATYDKKTPDGVVRELNAFVDSIEFVEPE